jgi:hypothetical protein
VPLFVRTLCKAADTLTAPSRPSARTRQERHKAEFPGAADIGDTHQMQTYTGVQLPLIGTSGRPERSAQPSRHRDRHSGPWWIMGNDHTL